MKKKAVLILGGGVDSSTLLYYLLHKGYDVYALTFVYGQRHVIEVEYAKRLVEKAREIGFVDHRVVDITVISDLINKGSLMWDGEVPEEELGGDVKQRIIDVIVPNRNMIFLAIACGYAVKIGAEEVHIGVHKDGAGLPDCRKETVEALDVAVYLANIYEPVRVVAPFIDMTKEEIVELGLKLGVPYELTWSCFVGRERPCLKCRACVKRTKGFLLAGVKDPLLTDDEWRFAVEFYRRVVGDDRVSKENFR